MQENTGLSEKKLVCRFCLANGDGFRSIYKHETIDIPATVKLITNLVISESDPFSKHICSKCIDTIECIVKFRDKCLTSFLEAEEKLLSREDLFLKDAPGTGILQVEFIKCESSRNTDCEEYGLDEPFSSILSECEQEHDGGPNRDLVQRGEKNLQAGNTQSLAVDNALDNTTVKSSKNDTPSDVSSNESKFLRDFTLRDRTKAPDAAEKNKEKSSSVLDKQKSKPKAHLQHHRVNKKPVTNDRTKVEHYECEVCGKTLKSKSNYTNHRKMHKTITAQKDDPGNGSTGEQTRVFLCNICGRSFGSSSNLVVHLRRHNGQSVCECTVCGKGFPRRSDLNMHMRKHTGEKPFICPTCKRGFSRLDKLHIHIRTHTGEKPYECPCGRAYAQKNDLKNHQKRNICGQNFDVEKLLLSRPTSICIKSPKRAEAQSNNPPNLQNAELERNLNTVSMPYSSSANTSSSGLNLMSNPMMGTAYQSGWNNCLTTPHHFQQSERRNAGQNYSASDSYMHQSKLVT